MFGNIIVSITIKRVSIYIERVRKGKLKFLSNVATIECKYYISSSNKPSETSLLRLLLLCVNEP